MSDVTCPNCCEVIRGQRIGPASITADHIIIPEGNAEKHFLECLVRRHAIANVEVVTPNISGSGSGAFKAALESYAIQITERPVQTIILVGDNDDRPEQSFASMVDALRNAKGLSLTPPVRPWEIQKDVVPRTAALTLPRKDESGTLETLVLEAIEADPGFRPAVERARLFADGCATGKGEVKLTTREKARLSIFLGCTCTSDPSCSVQHMWQSKKGYQGLLTQAPFSPLYEFIRNL